MKAKKLARVLGALLFGGAVFNANAGSWSVTPSPATIGTTAGAVSQPITIAFTGDGSTQDASIDYDFDETAFTAQPTAANSGSCTIVTLSGNQYLRVLSSSGSTIPSSATTFCNVTFTALAANADSGANEFSFPVRAGSVICGDNIGDPVTPCDPSGPIVLDVQAAPVVQAPTLTFNPAAPGPIVLNATGGGSIAVTASTGSAGTSTTLACTSTNGTATATPASYGEAGGTGTVTVQCTPVVGAAGTAFTVSCDPTQSAGTDQPAQVFNATCPAITPQPEFSGALSASLVGAPGATLTGSIGISNTGNAPLTITCGAPTGGFTVTSAPASPVAAGGSTSIGISCVAPAAAGATATGSLVCTTNDTTDGESTVTFALSCTSQVLSVPSLGNTAKGLMIALLAGLGLLGFAMRRRVV